MTVFMTRLLSALILAPLILLVIWVGGFFFKLFMAGMMLFAFYEFILLANALPIRSHAFLVMLGGAGYCFVAFMAAISLPVKIVLLILMAVWMSDTGAYFMGKMLRGPKLAPKISPNKTIAGLVGACVFPALILLVALAPHYDIAALYGVMIGCIGQAGDIMISFLKRKAGVKDTGRLIPGHGGILDRVDALMLVMILFWIGFVTEVLIWPETAFQF